MAGLTFPPNLIPRSSGDWLAVTADEESVRVGVIGPTKEAAESELLRAVERWRAILDNSDE